MRARPKSYNIRELCLNCLERLLNFCRKFINSEWFFQKPSFFCVLQRGWIYVPRHIEDR
jgi:hypothetical protein